MEFTLKDVSFADAKPRMSLVAREPLLMVKAIRFLNSDVQPIDLPFEVLVPIKP